MGGIKIKKLLPAVCLLAALTVCLLLSGGGGFGARSFASCSGLCGAAAECGTPVGDALYDILPLLPNGGKGLIFAGFERNGLVRLMTFDNSLRRALIADLDIKTGRLRERLSVEGIELDSPLQELHVFSADPFALYDAAHRCVVLFDEELTGFERFELGPHDAESFIMTDGGVFFYDNADERIYIIGNDNAAHPVYRREYFLSHPALTSCTADGRSALITGVDRFTGLPGSFAVDTVSGSVSARENGAAYISGDGLCAFDLISETDPFTVSVSAAEGAGGTEVSRGSIELAGRAANAAACSSAFLFTRTDETGAFLCLADTGGVKSVMLPDALGDKVRLAPFSEHDGRVIVPALDAAGASALLLWDTADPVYLPLTPESPGEGLLSLAPYSPTDYGELTKRASAIYEKYGVTVLIGRDARLLMSPYSASISEDRALISRSLSKLEQAMALYPADFFRRLLDRYCGTLTVELCGAIRSESEGAPDRPGAVTGSCGGGKLIMMDMIGCGSVEGTFCHEICHIIDGRLKQLAQGDDSHWNDAQWAALGPEGFEYYDSYMDENGRPLSQTASPEYTAESGYASSLDEIWFANRYSKTFATEDRAVLFEALITHGRRAFYLRSPHVKAKLEYYFEAIRRYLDPENTWPRPTFWEAALDALQTAPADGSR